MIYRNSTDPVFLKKIKLNIWLLKDEIEAVIKKRLQLDKNNLNFDDLVKEYQPKKPKLTLLKNEEDESNDINTENKSDQKIKDSNIETPESQKVTPSNLNIPQMKMATGKTILTEVYMNRIFFFSDRAFVEGQSIVIEFCVPKKFIVNADIHFCLPYSLKNRIISENRLPYRICANFSFLKDGERTRLRQFISSIEFEETGAKNTKESIEDKGKDKNVAEEMFETDSTNSEKIPETTSE